ncbi:MAG: sulfur oxidation c-type cytochrome SoxX [Hyphomicrobiales bacterium]|nr:sulfur oxidation c-type cytochrome SoxX [Hyphomicrobiales bacterium]PCH50869.1 MAG: sulfur oxidation c-type cytochrome SoxX [Hyphomicrobiales bacterium]PCH50966.1 MAG: sulfur oxidation c-type cytochrome SoxX [Hyphomicrobiales bacterium]
MRLGVKTLALVVLFSATGISYAGNVGPDEVKLVDGKIAMSLTGSNGDAAKGRDIFINRKQGNCLACHVNKEISEQAFHGKVGPPLDGVAGRWDEAELRAILVNSKKVLGEETIMPSFYRLINGTRTMKKFKGKTILSAEQVEDVLAYLKTLKEE